MGYPVGILSGEGGCLSATHCCFAIFVINDDMHFVWFSM